MKAALLAMSLAAIVLPATALAEDNHTSLTLRSKTAIATAVPPSHSAAPYVQPLGEPEREPLFNKHDPRHEQSRSSCESGRDLCYDDASGRIVYKPSRQLMPGLPGLQAENISLKRDRIVFKYSF